MYWRDLISDHISPILASLHFFPARFRIGFKILVLTNKAIHGQSPSYLEQFKVLYRPSRTLHSEVTGLLGISRISESRMGGRASSYQAPLLWIYLPVLVKEAGTLSDLKSRFKTLLFDEAYKLRLDYLALSYVAIGLGCWGNTTWYIEFSSLPRLLLYSIKCPYP